MPPRAKPKAKPLKAKPAKGKKPVKAAAKPAKAKKEAALLPLVAGNWKMNGLTAARAELNAVAKFLAKKPRPNCAVLICPPATLIAAFAAAAKGTGVLIGAQDCHARDSGAFTGDIAAPMLKDAGATHVIVGHSERRALHAERDADVRAKAEAVLRAGLTPIVCVGESEAERDAGWTLDVVGRQVQGSIPDAIPAGRLIVAYEPVWAIGSGRTPTLDDIRVVHAGIRERLAARFGEAAARAARILYGGSVKPSNAAEILRVPGVDGALVGGASLLAKDFNEIVKVYKN